MRTRDNIVLVTSTKRATAVRGRPLRLRARRIQSKKMLREEFLRRRSTRRVNLFVSHCADDLGALADLAGEQKGNVRLLILEESLTQPRREFLETIFRTVIAPDRLARFLDRDELAEVLSSERRADLFIGGTVSHADGAVVLYRGDLGRMAVPLSWFVRTGKVEHPDFDDFGVLDFGQTIRFGQFEAATDAILYAFDDLYRREARRRQLEQGDSFGAALKRARLLHGLSREDFRPLSPKTIARIERGEVERPRGETLAVIARKLAVRPEEIATF